jgi:hypothetical protein
LGIKPNERRYLPNVRITLDADWSCNIEQSFRDDISGGFDMEASHLSDPQRLDTLLLALSVAVLWIYEIGERVLRDEQRREIDPAYKRQLSVFRLGWRRLRRPMSCAESPVCTLQLTSCNCNAPTAAQQGAHPTAYSLRSFVRASLRRSGFWLGVSRAASIVRDELRDESSLQNGYDLGAAARRRLRGRVRRHAVLSVSGLC